MRLIAMGDTHGRSFWKLVSQREKWDKFLLVGDYFDAYQDFTPMEQLRNFDEICQFKRENPDKVITLTGNHDCHYLKGWYEQYSGYQAGASPNIQIALEEAISEGLMQMAYRHGEYLFTHAGVTKTWCKNHEVDVNSPDHSINELFKHTRFTAFRFQGMDMYGDDITQGPVWVRPQSLYRDRLDGFTHVVGHTGVQRINLPTEGGSRMILIDTLGSSREYLIIEDGIPSVGKI